MCDWCCSDIWYPLHYVESQYGVMMEFDFGKSGGRKDEEDGAC